jgi:hypothetical protein
MGRDGPPHVPSDLLDGRAEPGEAAGRPGGVDLLDLLDLLGRWTEDDRDAVLAAAEDAVAVAEKAAARRPATRPRLIAREPEATCLGCWPRPPSGCTPRSVRPPRR